jgi:hypothetical protein
MLQQAEEQGTFKSAGAKSTEGNSFLAHAIEKLAGTSQQPDPATLDKQMLDGAVALVKESPLIKNAALVYAHAVQGGELAEDEAPAEKQE